MNKRKRLVIPVLLGLVCMCLFPMTSYASGSSQSMTLTLTVPEKPDADIKALEDADTLKDIPLPEGWEWKDDTVEIEPGKEITVIAVYENGNEMEIKVTGTLAIILDGTDIQYDSSKDSSASIHCNGVLDALVSVEMDGNMVEPSYYTTKAGSTIVTFKKSYLDTLSVGKHTVTLNYEVGGVDSTIEIKNTSTGNTENTGTSGTESNTGTTTTVIGVQTGDTTNIVEYIMMVVLSMGVCILLLAKGKRTT